MIGESWVKFEPHSRSVDFSESIKATIHDPLWMLGRQWQLGKFEGESTGSPVLVRVTSNEGGISKVILNNANSINYNKEIPLEVFVERRNLEVATQKGDGDASSGTGGGGSASDPSLAHTTNTPDSNMELDLQLRVKLGLQFQRELEILLADVLSQADDIKKFKVYLAAKEQSQPILYFENLTYKQARFESEATIKFLSVIQGRVIDIYKIYKKSDAVSILKQKAMAYFANDPNVASKVADTMEVAFNNLKKWWEGSEGTTIAVSAEASEKEEAFFETPKDSQEYGWNARHLEYNFKVQIGADNSKKFNLDASEHKGGHIDWYSFTVDTNNNNNNDLSSSPQSETILFPTNLSFPGMPEQTWWYFEDSYIKFGSISPKTNNIASMILSEFALVHTEDWYVIPYEMEIGTLNQIQPEKGLIVIDSFGEETEIKAAGFTQKEEQLMESSSEPWDPWNMFTVSKKYDNKSNGGSQQYNTTYFFLPPTIDNTLSGSSMEEVSFVRDETADLAWAIEKKYRTLYGEPISGYDHYFDKKGEQQDERPSGSSTIKYSLMTTVPWNWIPFIPVHRKRVDDDSISTGSTSSGNEDPFTKIQFQRAKIIREIPEEPLTSPKSKLLTEIQPRYYIDEAEIPRTGCIISERCRRTVWYNGRAFLWISRERTIGAGEGSSGLKFDVIPIGR